MDGSAFSDAPGYVKTSQSMSHTFDTTNMPTLTAGVIYQIKFRCINIKGPSVDSDILYASPNIKPAQPDAPTVLYQYSSNTSLYVTWTLVSDGTGAGGKIKGYKLYADDGHGGVFTMIYSTVDISPKIDYYLMTALTRALPYRFKLEAYNFNGAGPQSDIASYKPCSVPSGWSKPSKVATTSASITVRWNEPTNNGGCPITGYAVFVDDGANGNFVEANVDNDNSVRYLPSLSQLTITRVDITKVGEVFRVKVRAYNAAGYIESPTLGVTLASLPLKPPVPVKVAAGSTDTKITVDISSFPDSSKGGCDVISYEIQMDDG